MDTKKSRVWSTEAEAGARKDGRRKRENGLDRQKGCSNVDEVELKIRMEVGLTGNTGGKNERRTQNQVLGHATKGQSQIKHLRVGVSGSGKTTSKEQMNNEAKGQSRNEDLLKKHVSVKRPTKGPQLDVRADARVGSSLKPGSGHQSRVFLQEKAQPGSRLATSSGTSPSGISVSDYQVLLKSLRINLPKGVLNPKVIRLSQNEGIIQKAQDIVKELENFKLEFNSIPRLGCRELKNSLSLKDNGKVLEITLMIFFEKREQSEANLRAQWKKNVSNTSCGFRFRDKYKTNPISTPTMYATTQTRSWRHLEVGDNLANISEGVTVNVRDIESKDYSDESALWTTSSPQRFGKYFQNPGDERECLKFYHELHEIGTNKKVRYTKGNKVEFGFLSGRIDFLAEIKGEKREKMVIECKGTTGDMISKVFTKPKNGGRCAHLIETHDYCYQVQAYMYILNRVAKQTKGFTSDRAVMVIRHYHKNGQEPRDFYWNYLRKNEAIQQKIDELCVFCEEEVLACFLAVLNLVFQKDT
ncbi:uncharacterized protein LOC125243785 [Megalobrama amblycephala]|uniref:uncharacterized protein LOC125243785 n=1 Tax=Megalobrama amblycephala TaxID=75352 RepID=UPI002013F3CF|nr:uncharacterized protein LOC125243785 [Megalobrama amblycephala]